MEMQYKLLNSLQIDMQEGKKVPPEKIDETFDKILKNFPICSFPIGK